jgi:hypothetical protein
MSLSLHSVVDAHLEEMNAFIQTQVDNMKELQRNLTRAESQVSTIEQTLQQHQEIGSASKAELEATIAALNGDLQSSLEGAQNVAANVTRHLTEFAEKQNAQQQSEERPDAEEHKVGGKRMKRSRRSNRGRKSMRK